jgi:hypothetical protein
VDQTGKKKKKKIGWKREQLKETELPKHKTESRTKTGIKKELNNRNQSHGRKKANEKKLKIETK